MTDDETHTRVALVTGGSRGLGRALVEELAARGWRVVTDGRDPDTLREAVEGIAPTGSVLARAGDVADPAHRRFLEAAVAREGRLDLLVNNASVLGVSPLPCLADHPVDALERVFAVNVIAPVALLGLVLPYLRRAGGRVVNLSSDAALEAYPGWGGYGAAKAALDHMSAVLAVENPDVRVYAFDPGDMATDLHQEAHPGEDIGDRPHPSTVVPAMMLLVEADLPGGRYRASDLARVEA